MNSSCILNNKRILLFSHVSQLCLCPLSPVLFSLWMVNQNTWAMKWKLQKLWCFCPLHFLWKSIWGLGCFWIVHTWSRSSCLFIYINCGDFVFLFLTINYLYLPHFLRSQTEIKRKMAKGFVTNIFLGTKLRVRVFFFLVYAKT